MLHSHSGTAAGLLQPVSWAMYVKTTLLGSTPPSVYNVKYSPRTSDLGKLFPSITLLVVITFGYSIISTMINGFAFVMFFLLYMLYKYRFIWVNDHLLSSDTGGLFFPKAISLCLWGFMFNKFVYALCSSSPWATVTNHPPF